MELEKLQKIIAEVMNVDAAEITPDTTFVDDLGADSLDVYQISWVLKKNSIWKFQTKMRRKSFP